jgi:hypothetical protein
MILRLALGIELPDPVLDIEECRLMTVRVGNGTVVKGSFIIADDADPLLLEPDWNEPSLLYRLESDMSLMRLPPLLLEESLIRLPVLLSDASISRLVSEVSAICIAVLWLQ